MASHPSPSLRSQPPDLIHISPTPCPASAQLPPSELPCNRFHHNPRHPPRGLIFHKVINPITSLPDSAPLLSPCCAQIKRRPFLPAHKAPVSSGPAHLPYCLLPLCLALLLWPLDLPFPEACPLPLPSAWNILPSDVHSAGDCLAFECQLRCSPRLQGRVSWSPVQAGRPGPHCRAALASFL